MKTCVVISSLNRSQVLHETVLSLQKQTIAPNAIVLSLCDTASLLPETEKLPLVRVVQGSQGLTKQRNRGREIRRLLEMTEYVLFLDDDTELAPNYLESMQRGYSMKKTR